MSDKTSRIHPERKTDEEWAGFLWPVTKGIFTAEQLVAVAKEAHRIECGSFDGGHANRSVPAEKWSRESDAHRHSHIYDLVKALDAFQSSGFDIRMKKWRGV